MNDDGDAVAMKMATTILTRREREKEEEPFGSKGGACCAFYLECQTQVMEASMATTTDKHSTERLFE